MGKKKRSAEEFFAYLIDKQFEFAGYTDVSYKQLCENKEVEDEMPFGQKWYQRYTIKKEDEDKFKEFAINEIKKYYKVKLSKAVTEYAWFNLGYGLKSERY